MSFDSNLSWLPTKTNFARKIPTELVDDQDEFWFDDVYPSWLVTKTNSDRKIPTELVDDQDDFR
jgi:hypothetical protein